MRLARRVSATGDSAAKRARRAAVGIVTGTAPAYGAGPTTPSAALGRDSPGVPDHWRGTPTLRTPTVFSGTLARVDHDVVRRAPLFAALDEQTAESLISTMSPSRLERGDVLFHEGDQGDRLYVIGEGKIKLGRTSSDGRENLLAILGPGEMFGELSLFDPGPRSATVTAVTDAEFASLSHEDLLRWLEGRPVVARGLLTQLAGRLRKANDVVADLVGRTADDGVHVHHDLTQEELAQLVGASRETVNKALADFASRGWLRLEPRSVVIMDLERLSRRAR